MQYVAWIIQDNNVLQVYTAPLPPHAFFQYDAYNSGNYWNVATTTFDSSITRSLEDLAIAAWTVPQTQARLFPPANSGIQASSIPTHVAVILKESASTTAAAACFWMYINQLSVGFQRQGAPLWSQTNGAITARINLRIPGNATILSTGFYKFFNINDDDTLTFDPHTQKNKNSACISITKWW